MVDWTTTTKTTAATTTTGLLVTALIASLRLNPKGAMKNYGHKKILKKREKERESIKAREKRQKEN